MCGHKKKLSLSMVDRVAFANTLVVCRDNGVPSIPVQVISKYVQTCRRAGVHEVASNETATLPSESDSITSSLSFHVAPFEPYALLQSNPCNCF